MSGPKLYLQLPCHDGCDRCSMTAIINTSAMATMRAAPSAQQKAYTLIRISDGAKKILFPWTIQSLASLPRRQHLHFRKWKARHDLELQRAFEAPSTLAFLLGAHCGSLDDGAVVGRHVDGPESGQLGDFHYPGPQADDRERRFSNLSRGFPTREDDHQSPWTLPRGSKAVYKAHNALHVEVGELVNGGYQQEPARFHSVA